MMNDLIVPVESLVESDNVYVKVCHTWYKIPYCTDTVWWLHFICIWYIAYSWICGERCVIIAHRHSWHYSILHVHWLVRTNALFTFYLLFTVLFCSHHILLSSMLLGAQKNGIYLLWWHGWWWWWWWIVSCMDSYAVGWGW